MNPHFRACLALLLAAGIAALTACAPAARPSAATADPAQGGGGRAAADLAADTDREALDDQRR